MATRHEARDLLKAYVDSCADQKSAARRLGISATYLGDLLKLRRDVPETLLRKLGYRSETQIVKAS